eukprot:jgi/Mesvir1/13833/Mv15982-RA.1
MMAGYTLYRYRSEWDLPSFDPDCMQAELFLRLAGIDFEVELCKSPLQSPTGRLPALEDHAMGVVVDEGNGSIMDYMRETKGINLDGWLSDSEAADLLSYKKLLQIDLATATKAAVWLEHKNLNKLAARLYFEDSNFLLRLVLCNMQKKDVLHNQLPWGKATDVPDLYEKSEAALTAFAARITSQDYIFGDRPTSLDAMLLAQILFHLNANMPVNTISAQINGHPELLRYAKTFQGRMGIGPQVAGWTDAKHAGNKWDQKKRGAGASSEESGKYYARKEARKNAPKPPKSEKELRFRRHNRNFFIVAGTAVAVYLGLAQINAASLLEELEDE